MLGSLFALGAAHWWIVARDPRRHYAMTGWLVASIALVSPLCALSVALFSARVAQHMILVLIAAPLIALALPLRLCRSTFSLGASGILFFLALWIWHMPVPYAATFTSVTAYWAMHLTLFGSAVWLWRELLHHAPQKAFGALAVGTFSFVQMGLLGAVLTFATRPLFAWHFNTTFIWGLTPLQDQQLGGVFMWVPGVALSFWTAIRSVSRMWASIDKPRPA
ncbi:MAG: cytochrome c oxidase assembly protein [Pseudomonadota bacterium]|nr:cytochrome c oxidase assembly protein [Pseudomonadota bacterium]